jgi:hypothetical protein
MSGASGMMAKRPSKPAASKGARVTILGLKGSPEFAAWAERLSKHLRLHLTTIAEHALIEYARARGFEEEPPER